MGLTRRRQNKMQVAEAEIAAAAARERERGGAGVGDGAAAPQQQRQQPQQADPARILRNALVCSGRGARNSITETPLMWLKGGAPWLGRGWGGAPKPHRLSSKAVTATIGKHTSCNARPYAAALPLPLSRPRPNNLYIKGALPADRRARGRVLGRGAPRVPLRGRRPCGGGRRRRRRRERVNGARAHAQPPGRPERQGWGRCDTPPPPPTIVPSH